MTIPHDRFYYIAASGFVLYDVANYDNLCNKLSLLSTSKLLPKHSP